MKRELARRAVVLGGIALIFIACIGTFYWMRRSSLLRIIYVGKPPYDDLRAVKVLVDDGGGLQIASGQPLSAGGEGALIYTRSHGRAMVRVVLAPSETIAVVDFSRPLRRGVQHSIYIRAGASDSLFPDPYFRGKAPPLAVPIRAGIGGSERDSLWVKWYEASSSRDIIY